MASSQPTMMSASTQCTQSPCAIIHAVGNDIMGRMDRKIAGRSTPKAVIAPLATAQKNSITSSCMSKCCGDSSSQEKPPSMDLDQHEDAEDDGDRPAHRADAAEDPGDQESGDRGRGHARRRVAVGGADLRGADPVLELDVFGRHERLLPEANHVGVDLQMSSDLTVLSRVSREAIRADGRRSDFPKWERVAVRLKLGQSRDRSVRAPRHHITGGRTWNVDGLDVPA